MVQIPASSQHTNYSPIVATTHFLGGFPLGNADIIVLHDGQAIAFSVTAEARIASRQWIDLPQAAAFVPIRSHFSLGHLRSAEFEEQELS